MTRSIRFTLNLFLALALANAALAQCNASFTSAVSGATVNFTSTAGPALHPIHWWSFGDGSGTYGTYTPTHTYGQPGTYTVTHFVSDSLGTCADSVFQQVTVNFVPTCHAAFTYTFDSLARIYTFQSQSTAAPNDPITYKWYVDGVLRSTAASFSISLTAGAHSVQLQIATQSGCSHVITQTVTMPNLPTPPPCNLHASFTYTHSAVNQHTYTFIGSPAGAGYQYLWTFGDGGTATTANAMHTYGTSMVYPVSLLVKQNGTTCRDSVYHYITVPVYGQDSCGGTIGHAADSMNANGMYFWVNNTYGTSSQVWTFTNLNPPYDSSFVSGINPGHVFPGPGTYQVCVSVHFNTGCYRQICDTVHVGTPGGRAASGNVIPSYPNPAVNNVQLRVPLAQAGPVTITIYNAYGTAVYTEQRTGRSGSNDISLPVQQLSRGQYYVDIQYNGGHARSRFQKL